MAREIVDKHLDLCLYAGVNHEGINMEDSEGEMGVPGSLGKGSKRAADDVWVARYLMARLGETSGVDLRLRVQAHSRRLERFWNALQLLDQIHARSRRERILREADGRLEKYRNEHIAVYRPDNHLRADRVARTRTIDKFNYGDEIEALPSACPTVSSTATRDSLKIAAAEFRRRPVRDSQAASFRQSLNDSWRD